MVILTANILPNSSKILIFLYLWLFGQSLFGFIILMQSFFSKARTASIIGTVLYFFSGWIDILVYEINVPEKTKVLGSIIPTVAISRGSTSIALFEMGGIGLQFSNWNVLY